MPAVATTGAMRSTVLVILQRKRTQIIMKSLNVVFTPTKIYKRADRLHKKFCSKINLTPMALVLLLIALLFPGTEEIRALRSIRIIP